MERQEPYQIKITGSLPKAVNIHQTFYLGYERNAWHSARANIYLPRSVGFSAEKLKESAEAQRVQGSVFKIEAIPMLVLEYQTDSFGIIPINDASKFEYDRIQKSIAQDEPQNFWNYLPFSSQNWLLIFSLDESPKPQKYAPEKIVSRSMGGQYFLAWRSVAATDFGQFLRFAEFLSCLLKKT